MHRKEIPHKSTWFRAWDENGDAIGGLAIGLCDTLGKIKDIGITNSSQIVTWLSYVKISEQMDDNYFQYPSDLSALEIRTP
jgi:hypothetical protein